MLDADADTRLQTYVQPQFDDGRTAARKRAIVALLLATGITSAEIRAAKIAHLELERPRPQIAVVKAHSSANRTVPLDAFGIVPLECWLRARAAAAAGELLFPSPRTEGPMNDMFMLLVVRTALQAIGFEAADMSPRVLRATYASRQLLAGRTQQDVTALLGCRTLKTAQRVHLALETARRGEAARMAIQ
jgi:integrase/recombinase XerD